MAWRREPGLRKICCSPRPHSLDWFIRWCVLGTKITPRKKMWTRLTQASRRNILYFTCVCVWVYILYAKTEGNTRYYRSAQKAAKAIGAEVIFQLILWRYGCEYVCVCNLKRPWAGHPFYRWETKECITSHDYSINFSLNKYLLPFHLIKLNLTNGLILFKGSRLFLVALI